MTTNPSHPTLLIIAQAGRLTYEAVLFVASLRHNAPDFQGRMVIATPKPGPLWPANPGITDPVARDLLIHLGAEIIPFESAHFGASYPPGNKVEALQILPPNEPFVFFDTDTLIMGPIDRIPFDFDYPSASMARQDTWPEPQLYGPGYAEIWQSLYDRFGVPIEPTLATDQPVEHWERYLYFNAGWFFHKDAHAFCARMLEIMTSIRDHPGDTLASQSIYPWLDQIALPIAIADLGGGRPGIELDGLDGDTTWHWRALPLLYAKASPEQLANFQEITAPNKIKKVLKHYEPFRRMIYHNRGAKIRALFDQEKLPVREKSIRAKIKRNRLWMR